MATPPLRNLSPMAEPWGRWAQEEIIALRQAAEGLGATTQNDGRTSNATMDNISGQVFELFAQQSVAVPLPDLSVTPIQNNWPSATVTAPAPDPEGGPRYASILLSGVPTITAPNLQAASYFQLSISGTPIARSSVPTTGASVPAEYLPSLQVIGAFVLRPADTIELTVWSTKFTADPGSVVLTGLQAVVTPAQLA